MNYLFIALVIHFTTLLWNAAASDNGMRFSVNVLWLVLLVCLWPKDAP